MTIRTPVLDDRSYAQLRDELIARIPVYSPEWTDHAPSDPGITLIELFAFLGENLLYRFNQIPDATKLAFLDLLHLPLRPARPATGMVRFEPGPTVTHVAVPVSSRLSAGDIVFQTTAETHAWPLEARAAIRRINDEELDDDTTEFVNRTADAVGVSADSASLYRTTFGAKSPMQPGGDVLDPVESIDGRIYVALSTQAPDVAAIAGELLTLGVVPASEVPSMEARAETPCPGDGFAPPSPPMQWQICTTRPVPDATDPDSADPVWLDLAVVRDHTAGLTTPGVVQLRMPSDLSTIGVYLPTDPEAHGAGEQPPLVEDPEIAADIAAWLRVFRPTGGDLPAIEWLDTNAAPVEQAVTARAEFLGTGSGEPAQQLSLVNGNVLGEVDIDVEEQGSGRWLPWTQVDDFTASSVDDRHFVVNREAGTIICGDGRRGRVWQIGERVRCRQYRHGGGAAGNVGPGSITKARDIGTVVVNNVLPIRGGADAEPLADAVARIPEEFGRRDRAVVVSDFRQLAESTPGAGIARAEVLRLFHPLTPSVDVAGAVSVIVWPTHDRERPNAPRPDRSTLDQVCRHLDARRLITTELHVIPPTYRKIAVAVGVSVKAGYGIESVRRWVELVLRQFLAPLPPYGPEGRGWPLGRRVFGPELEAAALQVEGVEFLEPGEIPASGCPAGLRLSMLDETGDWSEPADRTIPLEKWEVPELAEITVVDGPALTPGDAPDPTGPPGTALPVRSPMETC